MGLDSCSKEPCVPTVIMGEDKTLDVKLTSDTTGDPLDLTGASEIEAILLNADATYLEKKLTTSGIVLVSGPGGHFQILLAASESALLQASPTGSYSDIEVHLTIASKLSIGILSGSVNIIPRRYPSAP